MSRFTFVLVVPMVFCPVSWAASIGDDCKPKGPIAMAKEAWDPQAFWIKQLQEIAAHVDGAKYSFRLSQLDRKRDRVNSALDAEEMRTMGITPANDPKLYQEMASADREMLAFERQWLQSAVSWGEKCSAYARSKLAK